MTKMTTRSNGFFDMSEVIGSFPGLDLGAITEAQRKNIEALTQANQIAAEGMRAIAQRQSEIAQQAVVDASALIRDWTQPGAPGDRIAKSAEAAKQAFEKGLANARELNELGSKASADAFGTIARRLAQSFEEVLLYAKKHAAAE